MSVEEKGILGNAVYDLSENGNACQIYDPKTPRHWYNYLWNELGYCAQVSQTGHGRSYYLNEKADMCMLNGDSARFVYLRDEETGESWNVGMGPLNVPVRITAASTPLAARRFLPGRGELPLPGGYSCLWICTGKSGRFGSEMKAENSASSASSPR